MSKQRAARWQGAGWVNVEEGATRGATLGVDVYAPDGTVLTLAQLIALAAGAVDPNPAAVPWRTLIDVPPNVSALAETATTGLYAVTGTGASETRDLTVETASLSSLTINNSDGVAGDPEFVIDQTLNSLAAQNWALNAMPLGTGADTVTQLALAANTFPGRSSTGNVVAKPITDYGFNVVNTASFAILVGQTLSALASTIWSTNTLPIGTGANAVSQVVFGANTFPARASTGNLVAKAITDAALSALAGTGGTTGVLRGDGTISNTVTQDWFATRHIGSGGTLGAGLSGLFDATSGGLYAQREGGAARCLLAGAGAVQAQMLGGRSGGTLGVPTATTAGVVFEFYAITYTGSAWAFPAAIQFNSTQIHSPTAQGTEICFYTTTNSSASSVGRWRIGDDGFFKPMLDTLYEIGSPTFRVAADHVFTRNTYGAEYKTGEQSVSLTANTNNQTVNATTRTLRVGSNGAYNLTGLTGGGAGRRVTLLNVSAFTITLPHDVTSAAANRFFCPNNASVLVRQNGSVELVYDATSSRWRVIGA